MLQFGYYMPPLVVFTRAVGKKAQIRTGQGKGYSPKKSIWKLSLISGFYARKSCVPVPLKP